TGQARSRYRTHAARAEPTALGATPAGWWPGHAAGVQPGGSCHRRHHTGPGGRPTPGRRSRGGSTDATIAHSSTAAGEGRNRSFGHTTVDKPRGTRITVGRTTVDRSLRNPNHFAGPTTAVATASTERRRLSEQRLLRRGLVQLGVVLMHDLRSLLVRGPTVLHLLDSLRNLLIHSKRVRAPAFHLMFQIARDRLRHTGLGG